MITPSLLPAGVMALRTSTRQHKKIELGVTGLVVFQKKQVMEGPLWEMVFHLCALDDEVKLRTTWKSCIKGSKYGPYGGLFFFLCRSINIRVLGGALTHRLRGMSSNRSRSRTPC